MVYYAVANGKNIGIFATWPECNESVKGYKNAIYKKFDKKEDAEHYIIANKVTIPDVEQIKEPFVPDYYVYTDGACSNNGKSNALAGIGIFFGINDSRNVSRKIEGKQTNNTAELSAIIETYKHIENDVIAGKKIAIVTDSEYAIKCVTSYGEKCHNKNWELDIPNKDLVRRVYEQYKNRTNIMFIHVRAHTSNTDIHSIGNDYADKLANQSIGLDSCPYATYM